MAWSYYGDRRRKVGAKLRLVCLSPEIFAQAHAKMRTGEVIWEARVVDRRDGHAFLQFWCSQPGDVVDPIYTVFRLRVPEDPKWICQE